MWTSSLMMVAEQMESLIAETRKAYEERKADKAHPIVGTLPEPEQMSCTANEFLHHLLDLKIVEYGNSHYFSQAVRIEFHSEPQPLLNKQFNLLINNLADYS
jgi:hypothetical protein